jgi:hypothetical protein
MPVTLVGGGVAGGSLRVSHAAFSDEKQYFIQSNNDTVKKMYDP